MRRVVALTIGVLVALAGCGTDDVTYVGGGDSVGMYFTVPAQWHGFDAKSLATAESTWGENEAGKALLDSTRWQTAFDAAPTPAIDHVFANAPAEQPTAFASVRTLFDAEKSANATDPTVGLRDLVLPVSTLETQGRDDFTLVSEKPVSQGGFTGRRLVFRYRDSAGAPEQTVDQTAYLDPTGATVYLMVVRCSSSCFETHQAAIDTTVSSLTLKEVRGG